MPGRLGSLAGCVRSADTAFSAAMTARPLKPSLVWDGLHLQSVAVRLEVLRATGGLSADDSRKCRAAHVLLLPLRWDVRRASSQIQKRDLPDCDNHGVRDWWRLLMIYVSQNILKPGNSSSAAGRR